jgi:hypothetical protein
VTLFHYLNFFLSLLGQFFFQKREFVTKYFIFKKLCFLLDCFSPEKKSLPPKNSLAHTLGHGVKTNWAQEVSPKNSLAHTLEHGVKTNWAQEVSLCTFLLPGLHAHLKICYVSGDDQ